MILIYPVDRIIHVLNNWAQEGKNHNLQIISLLISVISTSPNHLTSQKKIVMGVFSGMENADYTNLKLQ